MDVADFLLNGVRKPNPSYSKSTAKKGEKPFLISNNPSEQHSLGESIGTRMSENSYVINDIDDIDSYTSRSITINPVDSLGVLRKSRAENQSWTEQLGNSLVQIASEAGFGIVEGFSNLFDFVINSAMGKSPINQDNDYTNPVSTLMEEWKEDVRNAFPIYKEDENSSILNGGMTDFGWWASNAPSIISSLTLLVPSKAATWGIGKIFSGLGKIGKIGKVADTTSRAARQVNKTKFGRLWKAARTDGTTANAIVNTAGTAGFSRILENYQESAQVYKDINKKANEYFNSPTFNKEEFIKDHTDAEGNFDYADLQDENGNVDWNGVAKRIANESANEDFKDNLVNFFSDFLQIYALRNFVKGFKSKDAGRNVRQANVYAAKSFGKSAAELAEKNTTGKIIGNKILNIADRGKLVMGAELSEGVEEMVNYVAQEEGMHLGNVLLGDEVDNSFDTRLSEYMRAGQFWDSAFLGWIGGIVFQGFSSLASRTANKLMKNEKLSETESRKLEISSRADLLNDLIRRTELIDKGYNVYDAKKQDGTQKDSENPDTLYNKFEEENGDIEIQKVQAKQRLSNEVLTTMIVRAAAEGNLDLLRTYLQDDNIQKQLGIKNVANTEDINQWNAYVTKKIDNVAKKMDDVISFVSDLHVPAHYAQMIAINNVYTQIQAEMLGEEIDNVNSEIDRILSSGRLSVSQDDAIRYRDGIEAQVFALKLRKLRQERAKLAKMKTISSQIGLRNIDAQIKALEDIIDTEFINYADYILYNSKLDNPKDATSYRNEQIDYIASTLDENLSESERKQQAAHKFDSSIHINAFSNLYAQDQGLAQLYNALALYRIEQVITKNDAKLTTEKVDELVATYDAQYRRAYDKTAQKASTIITDMLKKYDTNEVYAYIENSSNEIKNISKKDKKSLDSALASLDLLNPNNESYMNGIKQIYASVMLEKAINEQNNGVNEDPGNNAPRIIANDSIDEIKVSPNGKFKLDDRVKFNYEDNEITGRIIGISETGQITISVSNTNSASNSTNGNTTLYSINENDLTLVESKKEDNPFNPDGTVNGQEQQTFEEQQPKGNEPEDIQAVRQRVLSNKFTNDDARKKDGNNYVKVKEDFEYNENQPGDIIVWGNTETGNTKRGVILNVRDNSSQTMDVLLLDEPDSNSKYGYKTWPVYPTSIVKNETKDERIAEVTAETERQKQELLNSPETVSASVAYNMFANTPTIDDNIDWKTITEKTISELARRGMDTGTATSLAVQAITALHDRYGDKATMKSDIAELCGIPAFTKVYADKVKEFVDRYLKETNQGTKVGNKRYVNIQALIRYAKTHGADNNQVNQVFYNLKNFLLQSSTDTNSIYIITDDYQSLEDIDFLIKTDMTVDEVNKMEEEKALSQRIDISSIIAEIGVSEFNDAWKDIKEGTKLDYSIEENDIVIFAPNGKKIGRLPIVRVDNNKDSKTYGSYTQINDGWLTDVKPVNNIVKSRFIDWLKTYLSDPNSDLFQLVKEWGATTDSDIRKELIKKIHSTTGWKVASRMGFIQTTDDNVLINGLFKLWRYNNNSNSQDEYIKNYDSWARKLVNSYSSVSRFVAGTNTRKGTITVDYVTEGTTILVNENESDVPSKTIANLDTSKQKLASFYPNTEDPTLGIYISGEKSPYVGNIAYNIQAGRTFIMLPNRSGSPTFIQTSPIAVNDVQSEEGKKFIAAIKNEMFFLINEFAKNSTDENFKALSDFVSKVFSVVNNEASLFYSKDSGQHRGQVGNLHINIDLGYNKRFAIHRFARDGRSAPSILKIGNNQYNLDRKGIIAAVQETFDNLVLHTEHYYVKNDSRDSNNAISNGIVKWENGKFHINTKYYNGTFDSYSAFMIGNDLLKARTKIVNGSNFNSPQARIKDGKLQYVPTLKVKLTNPSDEDIIKTELPDIDIRDRILRVFYNKRGNKSNQILRLIFKNNKALKDLLDLDIFSKDIKFANERIGAFAVTVVEDMTPVGSTIYQKGDIVFGKEWLDKIATDPNSAGLDIIHENLHKQLLDPKNREILKNINRIYDEFIDSLSKKENLEKFAKENGLTYEQVKNWVDNQVIPGITNHESSDQNVEEFLVQSLTNRSIAKYLNSVDATDYNKENTKKSLWQKLLELVQKLFGLETREGSLREKEFYALSDVFDDSKYTLKDRTDENKGNQGEEGNEVNNTEIIPNMSHRPTGRPGGRPRRGNGIFSDIVEIDVQTLNLDTYLSNFRNDLQPEISHLLDTGTLNLKCS